MPPRLPALSTPLRCSGSFVAAVTQRLSAVSISSSAARFESPRPSSGASFLDLDRDYGRPAGSSPGSRLNRNTSAGDVSSSSSNNNTFDRNNNTSANAALSRVLFDSETRRRLRERQEEQKRTALERMAERKVSDDYARQMPRRWRVGDLYAPHDLSPAEAAKWRRPARTTADVVDILGLNPLDEYRNFAMISEFMTPMGRIKHSRETGLRPVNQRRMARAIRRAIGLGLHPSVHRHPEILASEISNLPKQSYASHGGGRRMMNI